MAHRATDDYRYKMHVFCSLHDVTHGKPEVPIKVIISALLSLSIPNQSNELTHMNVSNRNIVLVLSDGPQVSEKRIFGTLTDTMFARCQNIIFISKILIKVGRLF